MRLDAAYQKKVERGFEIFTEPIPPTTCMVVDSECDQVFRLTSPIEELSGKTVHDRKSISMSFSQEQMLRTSVGDHCFYNLDNTQVEGSDDGGSDRTLWSSGSALSDTGSRRGSDCALSSTDVDSVDSEKIFKAKGLSTQSSQAWWKTHSRTMSFESDSIKDSPISMPAQCRIEQGGSMNEWNANKVKHQHHRSQSY